MSQRMVRGIVAAILFLLIGLGVLWFATQKLELAEEEATLVALLLLPAVLYLAISGQLRELRVGPLEAKLAEPASEDKEFTKLEDEHAIESVTEDIVAVLKQEAGRLPEVLSKLSEMEGDKPPVLYLILGKTYSAGDLEAYIRDLKHIRGFKFVVIALPDLSIMGYIPYYSLESILGLEGRASAFLNLIARTDLKGIREYPGIRTVFLTPRTTKREALQLMLNERLESLLVLDHKQKLRAVVEREQLVGQLLLDLGS